MRKINSFCEILNKMSQKGGIEGPSSPPLLFAYGKSVNIPNNNNVVNYTLLFSCSTSFKDSYRSIFEDRLFRKNCVFFNNSLQTLPRLHHCKRSQSSQHNANVQSPCNLTKECAAEHILNFVNNENNDESRLPDGEIHFQF